MRHGAFNGSISLNAFYVFSSQQLFSPRSAWRNTKSLQALRRITIQTAVLTVQKLVARRQVDGIAQQQNGSHRVLHPLTHANDRIPSQSSSWTDPYLPRPRIPPTKKSKIPCVLGRNAFLSVPGPGPPSSAPQVRATCRVRGSSQASLVSTQKRG